MQRTLLDYAVISLKGLAMGAADAVPGVSGGTIALIAGIYRELIDTISNIDLELLKTIKTDGFKVFWAQLNGNFILALLTGILVSFVSFMRLAKYLIENEPILIWSFFFGLVVASIIFVAKQITRWKMRSIIGIIAGAIFAYYISTLPAMSDNDNPLFLLFAGSLAICAMILPGISGAFILVILGAYKALSDAIHNFNLERIGLFVLGAVVGLLSFSRVLKWLFRNYPNLTLAILTGFIIGSLNKIWPWKEVLTWRKNSEGNDVPVLEQSILPWHYEGEPQMGFALMLMFAGFLTILILERLGTHKNIDGKHKNL